MLENKEKRAKVTTQNITKLKNEGKKSKGYKKRAKVTTQNVRKLKNEGKMSKGYKKRAKVTVEEKGKEDISRREEKKSDYQSLRFVS